MAIVNVPHSSFGGAVDVSLSYDDGTGQLLSIDLKSYRFALVTVTVTNLAGHFLREAQRALDGGHASIDVRDLGLTVTTAQTVKGSSWKLDAVISTGAEL